MTTSPSRSKPLVVVLADAIDEQDAGIHQYLRCVINELEANRRDRLEFLYIHSRPNVFFTDRQHLVVPHSRLPLMTTWRRFGQLPRLAKQLGAAAVWEPGHFGPFHLPDTIKRITTIHDLTPINMPHYHGFWGRTLHRIFLPGIIKNADLIFSVSQNTADDLARYQEGVLAKTKTIPLACDLNASLVFNPSVLKRHQIQGPYFLFVGTVEPRKNLVRLVVAFEKFKETGQSHKLVIVGQLGWDYSDFIEKINNSRYKLDIICLGYVPRVDLVSLYQGATALVYPSLYEGFGLPLLEAMTCGAPCLCSNNSSLPEVAGGAALYFDASSVEQIAQLMAQVALSSELRDELSRKSKMRASQFSWREHGIQVEQAICDLINA